MYRNKYDNTGKALAMGINAEAKFVNYVKSKGWTIKRGSFQEDIKHIDYYLSRGTEVFTVDVKAEKRVGRNDSDTNPDKIWIELQNVQGNVGWLYADKLDLIAFENGDSYLVVKRDELASRVENLIEDAETVNNPHDALYSLYTRRGRKDLLTMVLKSDIIDLHTEL